VLGGSLAHSSLRFMAVRSPLITPASRIWSRQLWPQSLPHLRLSCACDLPLVPLMLPRRRRCSQPPLAAIGAAMYWRCSIVASSSEPQHASPLPRRTRAPLMRRCHYPRLRRRPSSMPSPANQARTRSSLPRSPPSPSHHASNARPRGKS
jgi:hypothetical protein